MVCSTVRSEKHEVRDSCRGAQRPANDFSESAYLLTSSNLCVGASLHTCFPGKGAGVRSTASHSQRSHSESNPVALNSTLECQPARCLRHRSGVVHVFGLQRNPRFTKRADGMTIGVWLRRHRRWGSISQNPRRGGAVACWGGCGGHLKDDGEGFIWVNAAPKPCRPAVLQSA
jgi:hypothetical protein